MWTDNHSSQRVSDRLTEWARAQRQCDIRGDHGLWFASEAGFRDLQQQRYRSVDLILRKGRGRVGQEHTYVIPMNVLIGSKADSESCFVFVSPVFR